MNDFNSLTDVETAVHFYGFTEWLNMDRYTETIRAIWEMGRDDEDAIQAVIEAMQ